LGISERSGGSLSNNIIREEATSSVEGSAGENSSIREELISKYQLLLLLPLKTPPIQKITEATTIQKAIGL